MEIQRFAVPANNGNHCVFLVLKSVFEGHLLHSHAPRMVPFPDLGSRSLTSLGFMCFIKKDGSNKHTKKKNLFHILLLRVSNKETQRTRYNDYSNT